MVSIVTDRDAKLDDPVRNPHDELVGGGEESMPPGTNQNHHNHRGGGASRDEHHNQQQQHMKAFNKRQSEMRRMKELSKTKTVSLSAGRRH